MKNTMYMCENCCRKCKFCEIGGFSFCHWGDGDYVISVMKVLKDIDNDTCKHFESKDGF